MPKKTRKSDIEKNVMTQIEKGKVKMRPRAYFILGWTLMGIGVITTLIVSAVFLSINVFSLRIHGPFYQLHLQHMLRIFPWWAFIVALAGIISGYYLLKRYDFSYKKNSKLIIVFILVCITLAAYLIDYFNLNNLLLKQPPFRGFYRAQIEKTCQDNPNCRLNPRINRELPNNMLFPSPQMKQRGRMNILIR